MDVGTPAYGQLQKLHSVDTENVRVGAEEGEEVTQGSGGYQATQGARYQAAWQPKASRALYITLTDGLQSVKAFEYKPLTQLQESPKPGTKVKLKGPLTVRRGVIMLGPDQLTVLGGEAEDLLELFSEKAVLEARLGRTDVGQTSRFTEVTSQQERHHQRQMVTNQQQQQGNNDQQQQQEWEHEVNQGFEDADFPDDFPDDFPENLADSGVTEWTPSGSEQQPRAASPDPFPEDDLEDELLVAASQELESSQSAYSAPAAPTSTTYFAPLTTAPAAPIAVVAPRSSTFASPEPSKPCLFGDQARVPQAVASEPWTYLSLLLPLLQARSGFTAKVKVVSATLASKIALRKTASGPAWSLSIMINDGSGSLAARLDPGLLDQHLGSAAGYTQVLIMLLH